MEVNATILDEYNPGNNDIIYYYCSAETFRNVMYSKSLWLCDVKRMNDSEEIIYGQNLFLDLMKELPIPENRRNEIEYYYNLFHNNLVTLSACFSESSEILSQWRGYADDAKGFCIGFNAKKLKSTFPFCALKIVYGVDKQKELIRKKLNDVLCHIVSKTPAYETIIGELLFIFAQIKHPSFKEEREIRFVHNIILNEDYSLTDSVKEEWKQYNEYLDGIFFRLVNNIPSPYVKSYFMRNEEDCPIEEVVIGSKNASTLFDVQLFLKYCGYHDINIKRFDSSYM